MLYFNFSLTLTLIGGIPCAVLTDSLIWLPTKQVYVGIEGLERSLGLDTSDPIIQFVVLFGISSTLW